ncbi:MAG: hypothetical protein KC613_26440, partial [Myxococcales bacterium]|nr:hypothetical protein [Myxococcales bacterium]
QQDWFTTYYGGFGFVSYSNGLDDAIEESGGVIQALQGIGVDPDIEIYVVAGGNPILSSAGFGGLAFAAWFSDADAAGLRNFWQDGVQAVLDLYFPWWAIFEDDLDRLAAGTAFLGEISGPSDGLLFVDSALDEEALGARGAQATEVRLFRALNHVELLAAGSLFSAFHADRNNGFYDPTLAARYAEADNQIVEWIIARLSQPVPEAMPAQADAGPPDATFEDAAPEDAAPQDAEVVDAAPDAAVVDAAVIDAAPIDVPVADIGLAPQPDGSLPQPNADGGSGGGGGGGLGRFSASAISRSTSASLRMGTAWVGFTARA